jgi:hypothetical protein
MAALNARITAADEAIKKLHAKLPEMETAFKSSGAKVAEPKDFLARWALEDKVEGEGPSGAVIKANFEGGDKPTFVAGKLGKAFKTDGAKWSIDADQALEFEAHRCLQLRRMDQHRRPRRRGPEQDGRGSGAQGLRPADHAEQGGRTHSSTPWPSNALKVTTKNPIPMNQWVHVFVTYDGSSKAAGAKIYVDGKLQELVTEVDALTGSIKAAAAAGDRASRELHGAAERLDRRRPLLQAHARAGRGDVAGAGSGCRHDPADPARTMRTPEQKATIAKLLLAGLPEYVTAESDKAKAAAELAVVDNDPRNTTMIMEDLPKPRDTFRAHARAVRPPRREG